MSSWKRTACGGWNSWKPTTSSEFWVMSWTTRSIRTTPESQPLRLPPGAVWSAPSTLKVAGRKNVAGVVCRAVVAADFAVEDSDVVDVVEAAVAASVVGATGEGPAVDARVAATASAAEMAPTRMITRELQVVAGVGGHGSGLTVVGEVASSRWPTAASSAWCPETPIDVTGVTPAV